MRSSYLARLLTYLIVMGPGLVVMEADNDAGAVATYAQAGGQYGLHLLQMLLILSLSKRWRGSGSRLAKAMPR
jgi:Mn2+/Fe2+ NRAMP family transporter